jgi:hypothetical protein
MDVLTTLPKMTGEERSNPFGDDTSDNREDELKRVIQHKGAILLNQLCLVRWFLPFLIN